MALFKVINLNIHHSKLLTQLIAVWQRYVKCDTICVSFDHRFVAQNLQKTVNTNTTYLLPENIVKITLRNMHFNKFSEWTYCTSFRHRKKRSAMKNKTHGLENAQEIYFGHKQRCHPVQVHLNNQ
jgi:hypothetical protein